MVIENTSYCQVFLGVFSKKYERLATGPVLGRASTGTRRRENVQRTPSGRYRSRHYFDARIWKTRRSPLRPSLAHRAPPLGHRASRATRELPGWRSVSPPQLQCAPTAVLLPPTCSVPNRRIISEFRIIGNAKRIPRILSPDCTLVVVCRRGRSMHEPPEIIGQ